MDCKDWEEYEKAIKRVYLNGRLVDPETIDPFKHMYVGLFRPPINPIANPKMNVMCRCGEVLKYQGQEIEHYQKGCWDVSQYVSIEGVKE